LKRAQRPEKVSDFNAGYANGDPHKVPGFSSDSTILELQMLISRGWLGAEDVGTLVKQIERKKVRLIQEGFTLFQRDIHAVGGTLTPMPQEFYLSQVNLASPGECAGIANTLALAMQSGQETTYLAICSRRPPIHRTLWRRSSSAPSGRFMKQSNTWIPFIWASSPGRFPIIRSPPS